MDQLKFDDKGLITAVAQDAGSGDIRMVAWMNHDAVAATLSSGKATFYSRSRQKLWLKGETSGHFLHVQSISVDCDLDTLLLRVTADGPSCHTGQPTCFFQNLDASGKIQTTEAPPPTFIRALEQELKARQTSSAEKSYTKHLLSGGAGLIGEKVLEEAAEFSEAIASQNDERVLNEAADVIYHLLVGLRLRGLSFTQVSEVLAKRSGVSGHIEKESRGTNCAKQADN